MDKQLPSMQIWQSTLIYTFDPDNSERVTTIQHKNIDNGLISGPCDYKKAISINKRMSHNANISEYQRFIYINFVFFIRRALLLTSRVYYMKRKTAFSWERSTGNQVSKLQLVCSLSRNQTVRAYCYLVSYLAFQEKMVPGIL